MGEVVWNGSTVDLEFTHADREPLGHRCFVPGFITQRMVTGLPGNQRKGPFPRDGQEALARTLVSSWQSTEDGLDLLMARERYRCLHDLLHPAVERDLRGFEEHPEDEQDRRQMKRG